MVRHYSFRENRNCTKNDCTTLFTSIMFCFADMLDKNRLVRTACTMLDWHIVNVAGMWILHPVYAIALVITSLESCLFMARVGSEPVNP